MEEFENYNPDGSITISQKDYLTIKLILGSISETLKAIKLISKDFKYGVNVIDYDYYKELADHYNYLSLTAVDDIPDLNSYLKDILKDLVDIEMRTIHDIPADYLKTTHPKYNELQVMYAGIDKDIENDAVEYYNDKLAIIEKVINKE